MKEQLITFETAKLAKEKGFHYQGYSNAHYFLDTGGLWCNKLPYDPKNCVLAPTQSLLQKWLRDIHDIHIVTSVKYFKNGLKGQYVSVIITSKHEGEYYYEDTYEEALEKGLQEALKLI